MHRENQRLKDGDEFKTHLNLDCFIPFSISRENHSTARGSGYFSGTEIAAAIRYKAVAISPCSMRAGAAKAAVPPTKAVEEDLLSVLQRLSRHRPPRTRHNSAIGDGEVTCLHIMAAGSAPKR